MITSKSKTSRSSGSKGKKFKRGSDSQRVPFRLKPAPCNFTSCDRISPNYQNHILALLDAEYVIFGTNHVMMTLPAPKNGPSGESRTAQGAYLAAFVFCIFCILQSWHVSRIWRIRASWLCDMSRGGTSSTNWQVWSDSLLEKYLLRLCRRNFSKYSSFELFPGYSVWPPCDRRMYIIRVGYAAIRRCRLYWWDNFLSDICFKWSQQSTHHTVPILFGANIEEIPLSDFWMHLIGQIGFTVKT